MHAQRTVVVLSLLFFHFEICHDMPIQEKEVSLSNVNFLIFFVLFVKIKYSLVNIRMFLHCHNNCHHFLGVQSNRIVFAHRFGGNLITFPGYSTMWRMYFDNLLLLHDCNTTVQTNVHHDTRLNSIRNVFF